MKVLKLAKRTIIFGGTSVVADTVSRHISATLAGPIKRGDLSHISDYQIAVILDGEFGQNLSVSPKEIMSVMDSGICVIGASSMGALRASELDTFGMLGVGWVYNRFANARIRQDDEVALVYSPITGASLTVPMVNILYWVEILERDGVIDTKDSQRIVRAARSVFFGDRSFQVFIDRLHKNFDQERVRDLLAATNGEIPDIKCLDAVQALLCALKNGATASRGKSGP